MIGKKILLPTHLELVNLVVGHAYEVKGHAFICLTVGDMGYHPVHAPFEAGKGDVPAEKELEAFAEKFNKFKLDDEIVDAAISGSMFGWSCGAAQPVIRLLKLKEAAGDL